MNPLISRFINWLQPADNMPVEIRRAMQLISALDAGGVPLDSAIIFKIAENLGLELSKKARVENTIERIRAEIARYCSPSSALLNQPSNITLADRTLAD
jgi:hypothetical protein